MTTLIELPQLTGRTVLINPDHVIHIQETKHGCCIDMTEGRSIVVAMTATETRRAIETVPL
ncbi:hypothetical protein [Brevundimonas diminuta]|uniref:hypothetical protein n=1 Tax=Brevundimonas diminuta TaxID=293 RepID=UPI00320A873A